MPILPSNGISLYCDVAGAGPAGVSDQRLPPEQCGLAGILHQPAIVSLYYHIVRQPGVPATAKSRPPVTNFPTWPKTSSVCWTKCACNGSICLAFQWAERSRRSRDPTPGSDQSLILFGTFCGGIWAEPASHNVFKRLIAAEDQSPEEAARQTWPVTYSPDYLAANAEAVEQQIASRTGTSHATIRVAAPDGSGAEASTVTAGCRTSAPPRWSPTGAQDLLVKHATRRSWRREFPMRVSSCWPTSGIARSGKRPRRLPIWSAISSPGPAGPARAELVANGSDGCFDELLAPRFRTVRAVVHDWRDADLFLRPGMGQQHVGGRGRPGAQREPVRSCARCAGTCD